MEAEQAQAVGAQQCPATDGDHHPVRNHQRPEEEFAIHGQSLAHACFAAQVAALDREVSMVTRFTRSTRCRANVKEACPFHGNAFHDTNDARIKTFLKDVQEFGIPSHLSQLASSWNQQSTHGFASAVVAHANPNLDYTVQAQLTQSLGIGQEENDLNMLRSSSAAYTKALDGAVRAFEIRKSQELTQDTDEATKIANLSNYLNSQIFAAKAKADELRAYLAKNEGKYFYEDKRPTLGGEEADMLGQEAVAYRLTEVRNKLDSQLKRKAKRTAPPALPSADWFANASDEDLQRAAATEPRIPFDWNAPLPGEKASKSFNWLDDHQPTFVPQGDGSFNWLDDSESKGLKKPTDKELADFGW